MASCEGFDLSSDKWERTGGDIVQHHDKSLSLWLQASRILWARFEDMREEI